MAFQQSRLYLREAQVIIGPKVEGTNSAIEPVLGRLFTQNRISFQVSKSDGSEANSAKISIYNMSQASRNFLETLTPDDQKKGRGVIFLKAGYRGGLGNIFFGDIFRPQTNRGSSGGGEAITTKSSGADIITTIEAQDAGSALQNARIELSLGKGATTNQIISIARKKLFVSAGPSRGLRNKVYLKGYSFSGTIKELFDEITEQLKVTWSIQDGELVFIGEGQIDGQIAVLITPATGLIGFPTKKETGFEFTSLLNPKLRPTRAVVLQSKQLQGALFGKSVVASGAVKNGGIVGKAVKVKHAGDTDEGSFVSKVECIIPGLEKL